MATHLTLKEWHDKPEEDTPFDRASARDLEQRLAEFGENFEVHFLAPVKVKGELPAAKYTLKGIAGEFTNEVGDVRMVSEERSLYVWTGVEWKPAVVPPLHWMPPVAEESKLPVEGNTVDDVRVTQDTRQFYICKATAGSIAEQWERFNVLPKHWLNPVKKVSELGSGEAEGDIKYVWEVKGFYYWDNAGKEWHPVPPTGHAHTIESHTWSIAETVTATIIPGPFVKLASEEEQTLLGIEAELGKGEGANKIEYSIERYDAEGTKEWAPVTGLKKLTLKKEEVASVTVSITLHSKDRLRLNIESVTATPKALSISAFVEHVAKVV